jgi:hypothetical protein
MIESFLPGGRSNAGMDPGQIRRIMVQFEGFVNGGFSLLKFLRDGKKFGRYEGFTEFPIISANSRGR